MPYDETNRRVLFRETRKKKANSPDYTGKLDVEGKPYRLAGWINEDRNGKKFLKVQISEPQEQSREREPEPGPELDDEIPF